MKGDSMKDIDYYEEYDKYGDREMDPWYFNPIDHDARYAEWLDDVHAQYEDVHQGCTMERSK
jgi:hypothetical protein